VQPERARSPDRRTQLAGPSRQGTFTDVPAATLVDVNSRVLGIPTLTAVDQQLGSAGPGIGFAIPSNGARRGRPRRRDQRR
jgi:hypothetical protein